MERQILSPKNFPDNFFEGKQTSHKLAEGVIGKVKMYTSFVQKFRIFQQVEQFLPMNFFPQKLSFCEFPTENILKGVKKKIKHFWRFACAKKRVRQCW